MTKTKSRQARRANASMVIAMLLTASVIVRLMGGTAQAIAKEVAALSPEPGTEIVGQANSASDEVNGLLAELRQRAQKLDEKSDALDLREKDLKAVSTAVEKQMDQLVKAEDSLRSLIALAEQAAEGDISQLTTVYENMKPKEAAAIFEEMAPPFAAGFLGRMKPDSAARIFAGLNPSTAYSISIILAGRNINVPTE